MSGFPKLFSLWKEGWTKSIPCKKAVSIIYINSQQTDGQKARHSISSKQTDSTSSVIFNARFQIKTLVIHNPVFGVITCSLVGGTNVQCVRIKTVYSSQTLADANYQTAGSVTKSPANISTSHQPSACFCRVKIPARPMKTMDLVP